MLESAEYPAGIERKILPVDEMPFYLDRGVIDCNGEGSDDDVDVAGFERGDDGVLNISADSLGDLIVSDDEIISCDGEGESDSDSDSESESESDRGVEGEEEGDDIIDLCSPDKKKPVEETGSTGLTPQVDRKMDIGFSEDDAIVLD